MTERKNSEQSPSIVNESFSGAELMKKSFTGSSQMRPVANQAGSNSDKNNNQQKNTTNKK